MRRAESEIVKAGRSADLIIKELVFFLISWER